MMSFSIYKWYMTSFEAVFPFLQPISWANVSLQIVRGCWRWWTMPRIYMPAVEVFPLNFRYDCT